MADLLLSALVPIVVQKSGNLLVQKISEMWGIDKQRNRLNRHLLAVQDVLTDAEFQGDANPAVKSWLADLKSVVYDADDVLDEFRYEELCRDAVRRGHKVGNVSGLFSLEIPILIRFKMSRKLKEVVGRIDELVTEMERFQFVQGRQGRAVPYVSTHCCVIESEVEGRGDDKENLVKLLTEVRPTENLTVLAVVGMGGLGKTTLAQLAYDDPRVKAHFKLLVWVCVSEEFDVGAIEKLIIDSIVQGDCNVPRNNMELLQSRLRQEICGKRYLLVMDNVWNDYQGKWEQLRALLNCGELGSTILVTTRNDKVAKIMDAMVSYNLGCLGEEDSWSLFHKRAFSKDVKEELVGIGKEMVKNCGGLPLSIKSLGSLMRDKSEVRQWLAVLEQSRIWGNMDVNDNNDVLLPILRLCYNHLPSYMKQCFAFCAVFPKDYVMEKDKLVQYWMAHGFIPSDGSGSLEMRGSDIFEELTWRSFFQDVKQVFRDEHRSIGYRSQTTCKMHDLMHDLAQSVMRDDCLSLLEPLQINNTQQYNARHISLGNIPREINEAIVCFPNARSLISSIEKKYIYPVLKIRFVKSTSLRIFDQPLDPIEKHMVFPVEKMKHLRYLDLSHLKMTTLPEAITTLYLLQTLRLNAPSKLPEGMRYMMSLRHLYIENCFGLKCIPPGLGELRNLETLTCYIVGTGIENRIGELKTLHLGGRLEIYNLREVRARDAREVNMVSKQNLDHLTLCWRNPSDYQCYYSDVEGVDRFGVEAVDALEVLDALKPCNKLKVLRIDGYVGDKFPVWMTEYDMLVNLVELHIFECRRCFNVPPLHRLPFLQILSMNFMDNLRHLCCGVFMSAEGGEDAPITFPSLKFLDLYKMPNLDCWCEGEVGVKTSLIFPVLSEMSIIDCPKLNAIPITPLLNESCRKEHPIVLRRAQ